MADEQEGTTEQEVPAGEAVNADAAASEGAGEGEAKPETAAE